MWCHTSTVRRCDIITSVGTTGELFEGSKDGYIRRRYYHVEKSARPAWNPAFGPVI